MPSLSIIIPTHKRAKILEQCLKYLANQTIKDQIEVIVVHDGEDDEETRKMIESIPLNLQPTTYFAIPKSQQGVARNRGVDRATVPIILFGQDDIFLVPDACEKHLHAHTIRNPFDKLRASPKPETETIRNPYSVLGFTTWDPAVGITPVMRWLERTGW